MAEEAEILVANSTKSEEKIEEIKDPGVNKNEKWLNEAESSMLEDQTMPTYLSLTDTSTFKPDESKVQPQNSPTANNQTDVVCLDSSEEEGEDNDDDDSADEPIPEAVNKKKYNYHSIYKASDEDDEDMDDEEDDDDIDEDEDGIDDDDDEDCEEEEEDEEDEEEEDEKEHGEFSDDEIESEIFERSSDDYSLRNSNSDIHNAHKERSKSLEELSPRSKKWKNRREMFMNPLHSETELNGHSYNHSERPPNHCNNDLNNLRDVKQANFSPAGRKLRDVLTAICKQSDISIKPIPEPDEATLKLNSQSKQLTDLEKHVQKNVKDEKPKENDKKEEINSEKTSPKISNDIKFTLDSTDQQVEDEAMEIDETSAGIEKNNLADSTKEKLAVESIAAAENLSNGQPEDAAILNIQTLTYDDYMKGNFPENSAKPEQSSMENILINYTRSDDMTNSSVDTIINPLPNSEDVLDEMECSKDNQISLLTSQLNLKSEQYDEMANDYQKVVHDNFQLKKKNIELSDMLKYYKNIEADNMQLQSELDQLRAELTKIKEENKPKEMKTIAVQTDKPKMMISSSTTTQLHNPKPSVSETDLHSTMSTIHDWTASEYSCPSVSLKPPNVDDVLNADSVGPSILKKSIRTPSRALLTTTRILQTLASITPRKSATNQSPNTFSMGSRKRKASESIGISLNSKQPQKVATINTNDVHKQYNMTVDRENASKSSIIYKNQNEIDENLVQQNDGNVDSNGIKCFVWENDDDGEERSCLIQAPLTDEDNILKKADKEHREGGPYLLGNLEVRLTETNGTLNVWGKDISQKSDSLENESAEEMPFTCSTDKKIKSPSSIRANITRHLRSMLTRSPSPSSEHMENHAGCSHFGSSSDLYHREDNCTKHHVPKRVCNVATARIKQTCCVHKTELDTQECHCEQGSYHNNPVTRYVCCDHSPVIDNCKHVTSCHQVHHDHTQKRHSPYTKKQSHCCSHTSREMNACINCSHDPDEPLTCCDKSTDTSDVKRRHRGKRVRNLVELLKSCGDCRNTSSLDNTKTAETEMSNTQSLPTFRVTPVPSSFSCSKQSHNFGYQNACDKTTQGPSELASNPTAAMVAEYEAALEFISSEITKLHAKTDSMCDMLINVLDSN